MKYAHLTFILILFLTACKSEPKVEKITSTQITELGFEKDLIPEGIAVDDQTGKVFLSSLNLKKIVQCNLDGSQPKDFIQEEQYKYKSGLGMETFDGKLFAIGSNDEPDDKSSILLVLNPEDGTLIRSYQWQDTSGHFFNDLAISKQGEIYITNSHGDAILKLSYPDGKIEKWLTSEDFNYANGIAISDDNKYLYVATYEKGVRIIDISAKKILNPPSELSRGMDGLKIYENYLIGIYNGNPDKSQHRVIRFSFDESGETISKKETLFAVRKEFNVPTTFDIVNDVLYFIANNQIDNFVSGHGVLESEKLEPYYLIRHPLKK